MKEVSRKGGAFLVGFAAETMTAPRRRQLRAQTIDLPLPMT
jgi:hypothetical protein